MDVQPPMQPEQVYGYVDEVAETEATTFLISPYLAMVMNFPSKHVRMLGMGEDEETTQRIQREGVEETGKGTLARTALNLKALVDAGHDPLKLVIDRAREKGLETFISVRLNEVHWVNEPDTYPYNLIISRFWKEHPQYWIGKPNDPLPELHQEILGKRTSPVVYGWLPGGLNFALPEVREWRLTQIQEFLDRYDVDGIELDFQRFPMYFKHEEAEQHLDTMTGFVQEVRNRTVEASQKRNHPILLSVRTMAKVEQNRQLGLDVSRWAKEGLVDFVVASHYLRNDFDLPIQAYREILPEGFPLYGSIEVEQSEERYRELATELHKNKVDGIYLFNYFTSRERGVEPDFDLARELGKRPAGE
ncbi:MAG: hypothetical protein R3C11_21250 [Planctomycetaceae bacterium]